MSDDDFTLANFLVLKRKVAELETQVTSPRQTPMQAAQEYAILPDPEVFSADHNSIPFEEWAYKITAKLQTWPLKEVDNRTKILYVATHTSGIPFGIIKDRLPIGTVSSRGKQSRRVYTAPQELLLDLRRRYLPNLCDLAVELAISECLAQ